MTLGVNDPLPNMATVTYGALKFTLPDLSVGPEQRALLSIPPAKELTLETVPLHNYRTDQHLSKGPAGLDAHGFTVVNHTSALNGDAWFEENKAEDVYFPEVADLVKDSTGAKNVVIVNSTFRRKIAVERHEDPSFYRKATDPPIVDMETLKSEKPRVNGKNASQSAEPVRNVHCDYSLTGLQGYLRHGNPAVRALATQAVEAEDLALRTGKPYAGPRYAAFSVWRPLKTVRRDPLVVADRRSIAPEDFVPFEYRTPTHDGEFLTEAYMIKPGNADSQKWYWLPHQKPDEVLIIKLADSDARAIGGKDVAGSTPHASPLLPDIEGEEQRESIEVRVIAFW